MGEGRVPPAADRQIVSAGTGARSLRAVGGRPCARQARAHGLSFAPALAAGRCYAPSPPLRAAIANARMRAVGEVPEWLNGPVSKTGIRASVSWVRIPPSPPR